MRIRFDHVIGFFFVFFVLMGASTALAQGQSGDLKPITDVFNYLADFLTTGLARPAAIIAIAGTGYLYFTGRIEMVAALTVAGGIALIFGAAAIVDALSGAAGATTAAVGR